MLNLNAQLKTKTNGVVSINNDYVKRKYEEDFNIIKVKKSQILFCIRI